MPQSTTAEVIDRFNHAFAHHAPVPLAPVPLAPVLLAPVPLATDSEARA